MKFITGKDRHQMTLFPITIDAAVSADNEVRFIDQFVDALQLSEFGFKSDFVENGRPAYHPGDLLKLFIYGYLNRTRSSRELEKECQRNVEVIWLMKELKPDHNTIANFRKDNPEAIRKVFKATVNIAKHFDLIGGKLVAGDSTKLRGQNSKKNNFNERKIQWHLTYIENKLEEFSKALSEADGDQIDLLEKRIEEQNQRKSDYEQKRNQLRESEDVQISTSDPDCRQLASRNNITEVGYNVQTTVDAKHNIPIDYKVTNEGDSSAMGEMVSRAVDILGTNEFTGLYDKGYFAGKEFKAVDDLGVDVLVAIPEKSSLLSPDPAYSVLNFIYDAQKHQYTCPQGEILTTNGYWRKKTRSSPYVKRKEPIGVQHFTTKACKACQVRHLCTKSKSDKGRVIERRAYAEYIEKNRQNMINREHLYRRRQTIVEHPYGVIKRQWGFCYIITKRGMDKASADVGLMFVAYNLRRLISIVGLKGLMAFLNALLNAIWMILRPYTHTKQLFPNSATPIIHITNF